MSEIEYRHDQNFHTLIGATAALRVIFADRLPQSLVDVGCGYGTWLRAAMDSGVSDVLGIDGVSIPSESLLIPPDRFLVHDLSRAIQLQRRFEAALCLEVAEHLDADYAKCLVQSVTALSDVVYFSAACPDQGGQHHVNCQWPVYWQQLFNALGYSCSDEIRWLIWDVAEIEPWYRQNLFCARRDPIRAGREPRLRHVVHPEMLGSIAGTRVALARQIWIEAVARGSMPAMWYLRVLFTATWGKLKRF